MAILNEIIQFYEAHAFLADIAIAAAATLFLFVFLHKRAELSAHAFQNTLTTLFVLAFNVVILICFLRDVDDGLQAAYDALGVPTLDRAFWDGVPFFVTCLVGIAAKDFADYWNHRFMHTSWGWPTHAAHHSDTHVNGFTSFRIHFLESLVMSVSYILLLTWLQIPAAIPAVYLFWSLHNIYVHLDLDIEHGPLKYLIASPRFHRWHHADVPEVYGKNLANVMPLWDRLFGTYYDGGRCEAKMGALDTGVADKDPVSVIAYPFLEWGRMIREAVERRRERRERRAQEASAGTPAE